MRHRIWCLAVALGFFLVAPADSRAQVGGQGLGNDPFSLYYGFYLPNQAYQAAQPRPEDTINANMVSRQYNALRDRGDLFDSGSPFGGDEGDLFAPYAPQRGSRTMRAAGVHNASRNGQGPLLYYNRTARYFPGLVGKTGHGPNRNIAVVRSGRGGGLPGGMGMPNMNPGPR